MSDKEKTVEELELEASTKLAKLIREESERLKVEMTDRPVFFHEVLVRAVFWMRMLVDGYAQDPGVVSLFEDMFKATRTSLQKIPQVDDTSKMN